MSDKKPKNMKPKNDEHVAMEEGLGQAGYEKRIAELEEKVEVLDGKYRRALADFANFERHMSEEQQRFTKLATQLFVEQMLGPYDHLQMAARHIQDKGLAMVVDQFKQLFQSQGLKELQVVGKPFDAISMEAVETRVGEEGKVLEVTAPGYELNGIVIRPAKVVVGKSQ